MPTVTAHADAELHHWAMVLAGHARRALLVRGLAPLCEGDTAACEQEPPVLPGRATLLGPVCLRCALAQAAERYAPPITSPAAVHARQLYRAARVLVERHVRGCGAAGLTETVAALTHV